MSAESSATAPHYLTTIRTYLKGLNYNPSFINAILVHAAEHGTLECFGQFMDDEADIKAQVEMRIPEHIKQQIKQQIERQLPVDPAWHSREWDRYPAYFNREFKQLSDAPDPTLDTHVAGCGCPRCQPEKEAVELAGEPVRY